MVQLRLKGWGHPAIGAFCFWGCGACVLLGGDGGLGWLAYFSLVVCCYSIDLRIDRSIDPSIHRRSLRLLLLVQTKTNKTKKNRADV